MASSLWFIGDDVVCVIEGADVILDGDNFCDW